MTCRVIVSLRKAANKPQPSYVDIRITTGPSTNIEDPHSPCKVDDIPLSVIESGGVNQYVSPIWYEGSVFKLTNLLGSKPLRLRARSWVRGLQIMVSVP